MTNLYARGLAMLLEMGVDAFVVDDALIISGESDHNDKFFIDYYQYNWGCFGVDQEVEDSLNKMGLFSEWINPGTLGVYEM